VRIAARGLHHVAIQVRDLERVAAFYREVLGLRVLRRWPAPDGIGARSYWLDAGDGAFLAVERIDAPPWDTRPDRRLGSALAGWVDRVARIVGVPRCARGAERATADEPPPEGKERGPTAAEAAPWRVSRPGFHLVALRVEDRDRPAIEQRLAAAGVPIAHRTDFTLYVRDPEGNRVGLSHYPIDRAGAAVAAVRSD
jgi:catechol 2,3-dioxygenase-like lactoylglutathione lyase family enzyme